MNNSDTYDYVIIGGGIVGISTAWQLKQRFPHKKIVLLEKESTYSSHQTGHNSGVIHAGVYYTPGSLKAKFCKEGARATITFCQKHNIPYDQCGKLLVATSDNEVTRMHALFERCKHNEIDVELLDSAQLKEREPNIIGQGAIYVKDTAIVNYAQVANQMLNEFLTIGGEAHTNQRVIRLREAFDKVLVDTDSSGINSQIVGKFVVACGGLMADRLVKMMGIQAGFRIIPYRGEYYQLREEHNNIVNHLIYPIPDPALPFLGVHLTRMIDGSVTVGPNAVQGWKREGYGRVNVDLRDIVEMLVYPGFWKVSATHFRTGLQETINSLWKPGYLKEVQKYCPQLQLVDLLPYPAGIRAQAVMDDGSLMHDFLFAESKRSLHVCNAPSPAATSAIPIGDFICDKLAEQMY